MRLGLVVAALVGVAACASASGEDESEVPQPLAATVGVEVTSTSARLLLYVTNAGDRPLLFTFPTSQRYDFVVSRRDGEEVYRWSDGLMFTQAITEATLGPGETWEMVAVWEHGGAGGDYVVTGELRARDRTLRKAAGFVIQ